MNSINSLFEVAVLNDASLSGFARTRTIGALDARLQQIEQ